MIVASVKVVEFSAALDDMMVWLLDCVCVCLFINDVA